jgi:RIO kinase 1
MNAKTLIQQLDELDDFDLDEKGRQRFPRHNPKKLPASDQSFLHAQSDARSSLRMTYKAARFEEGWLLDSLGNFYEHQWISDVLRKVKGGKEASVYLCRAGENIPADLLAVKVYRPRMLRNLKQDHLYREGRIDLDAEGKQLVKDADVHAVAKRTAYGEEIRHQSWIAYEFNTLQALYDAGADVPRAYEMANNSILMDYIGDLSAPAPALNEISLDRAEAKTLFDRVLRNIDILLSKNCIHGDLSSYNILYWDGDITLIDFPQVVSPENNRSAYPIFSRDVARVCEYFAKMGIRSNPHKLAADLWTSHGHRIFEEIHPRLLDAEDPQDRKLWERQKRQST